MNRFFTRFFSLILTVACLMSMGGAVLADTSEFSLSGTAHVQSKGTVEGTNKDGTLTLGTRGQRLRLEGFTVNFENNSGTSGNLQYRVHIQDKGWTGWISSGNFAGTKGESKRVEAVQFRLTGDLCANYDVIYKAHIQGYGDAQGWVKNGAVAGTLSQKKRVEQISVKIAKKDTASETPFVSYRTHIQDNGWEIKWKQDGEVSGTTGESKRLEAINMVVGNTTLSGKIRYRTHVQNIGWMNWAEDGATSGTTGQSKRLEAIQIELTDELASAYDIYYRVHVQNLGWLAWAKNGAAAGTSGCSFRLEGIQIVLVAKGGDAPGNVGGIKSVSSTVSYGSFNDLYKLTNKGGKTYLVCTLNNKYFTGWKTINGVQRYFCEKATNGYPVGAMANGMITIGSAQYMFENSTPVKNFTGVKNNNYYKTDSSGKITRVVYGNKPMVALTFDDGPTKYTDDILDTLDKYGAKATFFVIGSMANSHQSQLKREYDMGMLIGNHTYNHPSLTKISADEIKSQLSRTDDVVRSVTGQGTKYLRPPGGAVNDKVKSAVSKPIINWSVDTVDWKNRSASATASIALNGAKDGSIILMHDRLSSTAEAVKTIVPTLVDRGYQLVTIEEMQALRGGTSAGKVYTAFYP